MTEKQNFSNQDIPSVMDTEYRNCNFTHTDAVQDGATWKGHRLFPGDNTPRTFIHCNMRNCEPPPGSTLIKSTCHVIRPEVFDFIDQPIEIDGETITVNHYNRIVYGKYTETGYEYLATPKEYAWEREV